MMKTETVFAEKTGRTAILRTAGDLLRAGGSNCRIGLERESLRCTEDGRLSELAHPESLGRKDDNAFFTADWAESQMELITPPCESPLAGHRFLETLTDLALRELAPRGELLWPLSTPCVLPDGGRIECARFEDESENIRRRRLREKYPVGMLLLSGIHYNFSFGSEFLRRIADGADPDAMREFCYLKTIRNLNRILWFAIGVLGASPSEGGASGAGGALLSIRNARGGYRTRGALELDYSSAAAYRASVERGLSEGLIATEHELYAPVRLRFSESSRSGGARTVDRLELRIPDLNPFEKCGISVLDLEFLRLLFFFCLMSGESELEAFREDASSVAEYGLTPDQREKSLILLERIGETAASLHSDVPDSTAAVRDRLLHPEHAYAERIRRLGPHSPEFLRLALNYRSDALAEPWLLPGFDGLELSTRCLIREALKGGIPFEVVSVPDNILRFRSGTRPVYVVQATKTPLDNYVTPLLMGNKTVSKQLLREHGIRTPDGIELDLDSGDIGPTVRAWAGKRAVVKPVSTNYGIGISVFEEPVSESRLLDAVALAGRFDRRVLIEDFRPGPEFRFFVLCGKTVAVTHRRACRVVGDGVSTIHELIERANTHPWRAPGHRRPLVTIVEDEAMRQFLSLRNLDFSSVPARDGEVPLRRVSNISGGGEAVDATDRMPDRFKRLAEQAADAFGAAVCGVDMLLEDASSPESDYAVIEVNFNPALLIHEYPSEGVPRPVARLVLCALGLPDSRPPLEE